MYNFLLQNNNIIFFNLKKKKIKIQSNIISYKKTQSSYKFLEITGLKKNNISLLNKF